VSFACFDAQCLWKVLRVTAVTVSRLVLQFCSCCHCVTFSAPVLFLLSLCHVQCSSSVPLTTGCGSFVDWSVARTEWFSSLTNSHHISLWLQLATDFVCPLLHNHFWACTAVLANQLLFQVYFILRTHRNSWRCMIACFLCLIVRNHSEVVCLFVSDSCRRYTGIQLYSLS
jgi:hypothetical protein